MSDECRDASLIDLLLKAGHLISTFGDHLGDLGIFD